MTAELRCPVCQGAMVLRDGKHGRFYGCSGYPRCRGTRDVPAPERAVERPGSRIAAKPSGRFGWRQKLLTSLIIPVIAAVVVGLVRQSFVHTPTPVLEPHQSSQATGQPPTTAQQPTTTSEKLQGVRCPKCGAEMVQRTGKNGPFWGCSRFPDCRGTRPLGSKP